MFNTIFYVISILAAVLGTALAIYYAVSFRKEKVEKYNDSHPQANNDNTSKDQLVDPIKLFIYLDVEKMYSLSSQFFEGITNEIMMGDTSSNGYGECQKGEIMSGNFMANMMYQQSSMSESRSLNDFAFTVFEKELVRRNLLYTITSEDSPESLRGKGFVKVTGRISIYDFAKTLNTMEKFNDLGKAISYLQNGKDLSPEALISQGLAVDEKMQEHVSSLIQYGYRNHLEILLNVSGSGHIFSTTINRTFLKDPEDILISRYSQNPEKLFTIIGVMSQVGDTSSEKVEMEGQELKKNMRSITEKVAGLDKVFTGLASNECIIDPIAIFTEIG